MPRRSGKESCFCCSPNKLSCCASGFGLIHVLGGVGVGFVILHYFQVENLLMWGLLLLGITLAGHIFGSMKCAHCE